MYTHGVAFTRTYSDACGTAHALDLIGERWALLVIRELLLGPKRYSDLHADLPGISTNVLVTRLEQLEQAGVVRRRRLPAPAASHVYELTPWGAELEPVICQIGRWGARSPRHDRTAHLSVTSFVLSLRTNFNEEAAAGLHSAVNIRMGDDAFAAEVRGSRFQILRGEHDAAQATLTGPPEVLAGMVYGGLPLAAAMRSGVVTVIGEVAAVERFFTVFVLPPSAAG